jgi:hypothetical protein
MSRGVGAGGARPQIQPRQSRPGSGSQPQQHGRGADEHDPAAGASAPIVGLDRERFGGAGVVHPLELEPRPGRLGQLEPWLVRGLGRGRVAGRARRVVRIGAKADGRFISWASLSP